jgi:hypothetical protein
MENDPSGYCNMMLSYFVQGCRSYQRFGTKHGTTRVKHGAAGVNMSLAVIHVFKDLLQPILSNKTLSTSATYVNIPRCLTIICRNIAARIEPSVQSRVDGKISAVQDHETQLTHFVILKYWFTVAKSLKEGPKPIKWVVSVTLHAAQQCCGCG